MMDIYAATAGALRKWEPRLTVSSIVPKVLTPGRIELELTGTYGSSTVSVSVSV
jgi:phage baseplate assembly protein W